MLKTGLKLNPKKLYGADGYAVKAHVWRMPAPLDDDDDDDDDDEFTKQKKMKKT